MEVVNFYPKTIVQIEDQDNPALNGDECLMIVKEHAPNKKKVGIVVLYVQPQNEVTGEHTVFRLGVFWKMCVVEMFCGSFNPENFIIS